MLLLLLLLLRVTFVRSSNMERILSEGFKGRALVFGLSVSGIEPLPVVYRDFSGPAWARESVTTVGVSICGHVFFYIYE